MDGPSQELTVGTRLQEVAVFDDKAANDVLIEAETQIKSGFPTIAASSVVNRNSLVDDTDDNHTAIKFFSELVKPVKYRWKFQKDQLKTISPSKQGFHPRSQSPTFQRLVEANEKLHGLMRRRSSMRKVRANDEDESKSEITEACDKPAILRYAKSEHLSHRSADLPSGLETVTPKIHERVHVKHENRTIEPHKVDAVCFDEDEAEVEDVEEEDYKSPVQTPPKQPTNNNNNKISEFKVDFKKMDSHSELHLFLPHIDDTHSRQATPDNKRTRNNNHKVALPNITHAKDINDSKAQDEDKLKQRRSSQKTEYKKKKKKLVRIKSGNEEKEIRDRLNDVPTLISLENEKPTDLHTSSMCAFENCAQHPHHFKKTLKIRQA